MRTTSLEWNKLSKIINISVCDTQHTQGEILVITLPVMNGARSLTGTPLPTAFFSRHVFWQSTLQWRHNERVGVSNHQPHDCLFTQPLIQGVDQRKHQSSASLAFAENSPVIGEFPAQRVSNAENFSIWWPHDGWFWTHLHCLIPYCI